MEEKKESREGKLNRLSAIYGEVHILDFNDGVIGYVKKPSRAVLGQFLNRIQSDPVSAAELLVQNCLIKDEYDPIILKDDGYLLGASKQLQSLVVVKDAELKKN